jgi:hypothetical protein
MGSDWRFSRRKISLRPSTRPLARPAQDDEERGIAKVFVILSRVGTTRVEGRSLPHPRPETPANRTHMFARRLRPIRWRGYRW